MEAVLQALKSRRKPVQQRSRLTRAAILEAFVRLLVEKGYVALTMRDIALVAGVGLGTLYEYFSGKKSMAAHCMHQRFKGVGEHMRRCVQAHAGRPVAELAEALLDSLIALHAERCEEWSALILLERQVSDLPTYRSLYQQIVAVWELALAQCPERACYGRIDAQMLHAAVYGVLYQALMLSPHSVHEPGFKAHLSRLVLGYLQGGQRE